MKSMLLNSNIAYEKIKKNLSKNITDEKLKKLFINEKFIYKNNI